MIVASIWKEFISNIFLSDLFILIWTIEEKIKSTKNLIRRIFTQRLEFEFGRRYFFKKKFHSKKGNKKNKKKNTFKEKISESDSSKLLE